jgi:hypothetical protein
MKTISGVSSVIIVIVLLACASTGSAKVMAIWDFGPSSGFFTLEPAYYNLANKPTLLLTGADIDANGKDGVDFTDAGGIFHVAGQGAAWDDVNKSGSDNDAACTITLDTTGWQVSGLRWDYRSEKATSYDLDYRLSVTSTWIQLLDNQPITADWTYHSLDIDLSSFDALSNQSFVQILISDLDEGPGNDKYVFDNLQFTGVPEPATMVLLLVGAAVGLRNRR